MVSGWFLMVHGRIGAAAWVVNRILSLTGGAMGLERGGKGLPAPARPGGRRHSFRAISSRCTSLVPP